MFEFLVDGTAGAAKEQVGQHTRVPSLPSRLPCVARPHVAASAQGHPTHVRPLARAPIVCCFPRLQARALVAAHAKPQIVKALQALAEELKNL